MSILETAFRAVSESPLFLDAVDLRASDTRLGVDPGAGDESVDVDELGSRIVGLAGRVAAATCRWLLLVAAFDACEGYARFNLVSTARWLSHACGISHRTAVDQVRVARALAGFPELASALESGRISYCHARAISRVAQVGEQRTVADLVGVAEHGTVGQLETVVRGLRSVEHDRAADSESSTGSHAESGSGSGSGSDSGVQSGACCSGADSGEYVRHGWASRSSHWRLSARLDPERGALVENAVAAVAEAEGITHADALVRLGEIALAALNHRADGPPRGLRGHERAAVLIHLNAAEVPQPDTRTETTTQAGTAAQTDTAAETGTAAVAGARSRERGQHPPEPNAEPTSTPGPGPRPFGWLEDGPGLPRPVLERLLCACRVRPVVHAPDGSVLDLGRSRRVVDDRLLRALLLRDRHCAHPGCTSRHKLEAHHVIHWLHGGRTDMANLVLLCERHHHQHHDGRFRITRLGSPRHGRFEFRRADGLGLQPHIDPSRLIDPALPPVETDYPHIPDQAIRSKTIGDRLDRAWALAVLTHARPTDRSDTEPRDSETRDTERPSIDPWAA